MLKRRTTSLWTTAIGIAVLAALPLACNNEQPAAPAASGGNAPAETATKAPSAAPAPAEKSAAAPAIGAPAGIASAKVAIPAALDADDPNILGYVRLSEPNKALDRIAAWTSTFQPGTDAAALRQRLAAMQIDLSQLRAGANVTVAAIKSPDPSTPPHWVALVPAKSGSPIATQISNMSGSGAQSPAGDDVLLAQDPATLMIAQASLVKLTAINNHPIGGDLQIYLNAQLLMETYGTMLRNQANMLTGMMAMSAGSQDPAAQKQMANTQKMLSAEIAGFLDLLDQTKSVTENIKLDPDAAELSSVVYGKPGTTLAKMFDLEPASGPNLTQYVAGGHTIEVAMSLADAKPLIDFYTKYAEQMLPADKPEAGAALKAMTDEIAKSKTFDVAYAMDLKAGSTISGDTVAKVDNADALMKVWLANISGLMNAMSGGAAGMDVKYETTVKEAVRKVQGAPVNQFTLKIVLPADMPPQAAQVFKAMWGDAPVTSEIMSLNGMLLASVGHPIDALAEKVASGKGTGQMAGQKAFDPGAIVYGDVNFVGYMTALYAMLAPQAVDSAANAVAPPVSFAAYHQQTAGYYRLRIPKDTVLTGSKIASQMTMSPAMLPGGSPDTTSSMDQGMPPRPTQTIPNNPPAQ